MTDGNRWLRPAAHPLPTYAGCMAAGRPIADDVTDGDMQQVVIHRHGALHAIVAIHDTTLGPALGGTRFRAYDTERAALVDAMRLARGMTSKSALAGLALGGGKAVIIGEPSRLRSPELLDAYAALIDQLGGRYITAEDVGTTEADMDRLRLTTRWVVGGSTERGGRGDPSPATALGVRRAMEATAQHLWHDGLAGRHVAIQGLGKVGSALATLLLEAGCRLTVGDVRSDATAALTAAAPGDVDVVPDDLVHRVRCDIFSPCALGAVLGADTIAELHCAAVVGAANNQLVTHDDATRLDGAGVCWVPDYLANAGGIIHVGAEWYGDDASVEAARIDGIAGTTAELLWVARDEGITTLEAADRVVDARLAAQRAEAQGPTSS